MRTRRDVGTRTQASVALRASCSNVGSEIRRGRGPAWRHPSPRYSTGPHPFARTRSTMPPPRAHAPVVGRPALSAWRPARGANHAMRVHALPTPLALHRTAVAIVGHDHHHPRVMGRTARADELTARPHRTTRECRAYGRNSPWAPCPFAPSPPATLRPRRLLRSPWLATPCPCGCRRSRRGVAPKIPTR
eukprot:3100568-Lingulodinium_polyedra.AAC.1